MAKKKPAVAKTLDIEAILDETVAEVVDRAPRETDTSTDAEALRWAKDIYDVSCWIGDRPTKAKAGTQFRYAMWRYANENTDAFMSQLLPKAMTIMDRQAAKNTDDGSMVRAEEKAVKELERVFRAALVEAREMSV